MTNTFHSALERPKIHVQYASMCVLKSIPKLRRCIGSLQYNLCSFFPRSSYWALFHGLFEVSIYHRTYSYLLFDVIDNLYDKDTHSFTHETGMCHLTVVQCFSVCSIDCQKVCIAYLTYNGAFENGSWSTMLMGWSRVFLQSSCVNDAQTLVSMAGSMPFSGPSRET